MFSRNLISFMCCIWKAFNQFAIDGLIDSIWKQNRHTCAEVWGRCDFGVSSMWVCAEYRHFAVCTTHFSDINSFRFVFLFAHPKTFWMELFTKVHWNAYVFFNIESLLRIREKKPSFDWSESREKKKLFFFATQNRKKADKIVHRIQLEIDIFLLFVNSWLW